MTNYWEYPGLGHVRIGLQSELPTLFDVPNDGFWALDTGNYYLSNLLRLPVLVNAVTAAAPVNATYITQVANSALTNEFALAALASGLLAVTTATGVLSSVVPGAAGRTLVSNGTDWIVSEGLNAGHIVDGRLTITSGEPVNVSNTFGTTIYYAPYRGAQIGLYSSGAWGLYTFSEISKSVPSGTSRQWAVYAYWTGSAVDIELQQWTDTGTRATALVKQNGWLVKSGDPTRRYLGDIGSDDVSGRCYDSNERALCYNYYNQVEKKLRLYALSPGSNSWTVNTASWRPLHNDDTRQIQVLIGVSESTIKLRHDGYAINSLYYVGIGVPGPGAYQDESDINGASPTGGGQSSAEYIDKLPVGRKTMYLLEQSPFGTATAYSTNGVSYFQMGGRGTIDKY